MKNRTLARAFAVVGIASLAMTACSREEGGETVVGEEETEAAEVVTTDCQPAQATAGAAKDTAPLKIGTLLPETGTLAFLGPPMVAGV